MNQSLRISFVLLSLLAVDSDALAADGKSPPNILLILADDVGQEVLECYGGSSYSTPHLNQLASDGVRFRQSHAMAVCHPTRVCLLTGQYPFRLGHPEWGSFPAAAERRTVAQLLKQAGYATAIAGKWQLELLQDDLEQPHRMGFDSYCLFGWHEGARYYAPHIWQDGALLEDVEDRYGPDVYTEFLIDFMAAHQERPFFAFYSMALCHDVTDDLDQPVRLGPHGRYDSYSEMVTAMDQRVGRLVAALADLNLTENTVVVFFTDNGTPARVITTARDGKLMREPVVSRMGDQDIPGGKGQLTDAGTRVPLIVSWPGTVSTGQTNDDLIDVSDFLPTLVELAGGKLPGDATLDGRSFAGSIWGRVGTPRSWVFAEHKGRWYVKNRRWKLYHDGKFFDVENDPDEQHSLSTDDLPPAGMAAYQMLQRTRAAIQGDR